MREPEGSKAPDQEDPRKHPGRKAATLDVRIVELSEQLPVMEDSHWTVTVWSKRPAAVGDRLEAERVAPLAKL